MRFSDEQKEMLALLPNVKDIKTLRDASKLLLSYIIELYGMDFAKNNGYVFKTNKEILSQTGIKQERTLIDAARELEMKGYITRTAGQRVKGEKNKASEYRLCGEMLQYALPNTALNTVSNTVSNTALNTVSNTVSNTALNTVSNTVSNTALNTVSQYDALLLKINELEERIKILETQNTVSQNTVSKNVKYSTDTESDTETDTISKDNILNNNNTEEYNIKDHNKKKNISTVNLEKLKENSTVEIPNDEDKDNTSKVESSNNENLNEGRIPSDEGNISDNENPNDMPPLDVDVFFENNSNQPTEYRDNENLNESRIPSESRIETRDNISDNENSKADEIDCSVFGNETFDSDTISKTQNLVPRCVDGRFVVVEDNISNDENSKNNNLKTSENMKTKISKEANSSNSFIHFGRLVGVCDMKGNVEEYLFNAYDTLKTADDFSEKFTETNEITIDLTQLEVSQDCGSGVWGMLSFNNGEYSFTQSNVNTHYSEKVTQSCAAETAETSNNALQGDEISQVDNYTADTEKIAPVQPKTANKAYTNPDPNNPKVWEYIKLHLTMKQGSHLMRDVLDEYKEIEAKNIHSVIAYMEDMCKAVRSALEKGLINEMQFNDFKRVFQTLSKGKYNYWRKVFSTRSPKSLMTSEMKMWEILGKPKVVNGDDETSKVDNNKVYEDNVILPTEKDFGSMNLDEIKNTLLNFVQEHPNLSDDKKAYINNLCIAYAIEPQYVA